jgi:DNA-binding CsgD family transcriptional regulator/tetratricopeptide (TPR) repeat protein
MTQEQILGGASCRAHAPKTWPVRGRDAELSAIGEQIAVARSGRGSVTLISGTAGSGKSRLLEESVRTAGRISIRAGVGVAEPGDRLVPLNSLMAALFGGRIPLLAASLLPESPSGSEQRYWLIQELESVLGEAARTGPLLVCIDDLQWADAGTAAALDALSVRLAGSPIAWIGAFRPDVSGAVRETISRLVLAGAVRLDLGQLADSAVAEMITDHVGGVADTGLMELADSARGTPFWLTELLLGVVEEGLITVEAGTATVRKARLPARVREPMRERLGRMSPMARRTATVASVLGRRFSYRSLAGMFDVEASALLEPVDDLLRADLLREDGDYMSFRHDILREAVLDSIPPAARAALQRQGVDVRLAAGASAVEVAEQLAVSAEPGDSAAIDILTNAARTIGAVDPNGAAELSRRALELTPPNDERRGPLVAATALLLHAAGRIEDGRAFVETALADLLPVPQESAVLLSTAGMFSLSADARAAAGRRALSLPGLGPVDSARHYVRLIHNLIDAGRPIEAQRLIGEFGAELRASADPAITLPLSLVEGALDYAAENFDSALRQLDSIVRKGASAGEDGLLHITQLWRSELLAVTDRYDEAFAATAAGIHAARRDAQAWAMRFWEQMRGRHLVQVGRLQDAIAVLQVIFRPEEARPASSADHAWALGALAQAALHTGDYRLMDTCAGIATDMLGRGTPEVRRHAAWLLAQQAMGAGHARPAHGLLLGLGLYPDEALLPVFPLDAMHAPQLVRIALAVGDLALAKFAVATADRRLRLNPGIASLRAAAAHSHGLSDRDRDALANAISELESGPRRPALASALEDAGVLAREQGRTDDAIVLLGKALEVTVKTGATWDATRLRSRLRALGVRRRVVAGVRASAGWESLSRSEGNVVVLVTRGMTNREVAEQLFISPHTVNSHLRHIFTKLDIQSRVELTRIAAEHEPA